MEFDEWVPVYEAILRDFGYDRTGDERGRDLLASVLEASYDPFQLPIGSDTTVAIAGAGPSLESEGVLEQARTADVVIAASTAVDTLASHGIDADCLVTDLDKNPTAVERLTRRAIPVAVHGHGDNLEAIRDVVPRCDDEYVLPTTQAEPRGPVRNFGGFTDGDRAAFLADRLGAARLAFVGWDFDDPAVGPTKARKLEWAERLLYWLESRRDDRFAVLDGRRASIETTGVPVD